MYYKTKNLLLAWALAMAGGFLLHFLYGWLPNGVTALFSPVNESLWEHLKVIYWPYLLGALALTWGRPRGLRPWLLVQCLLCASMLVLGYGYHILLGGEAMAVDIGIYLGLMTIGFWMAPRFSGPFNGPLWVVPVVLSAGLAVAMGTFALWPPEHILFADLSALRTWLRIPL